MVIQVDLPITINVIKSPELTFPARNFPSSWVPWIHWAGPPNRWTLPGQWWPQSHQSPCPGDEMFIHPKPGVSKFESRVDMCSSTPTITYVLSRQHQITGIRMFLICRSCWNFNVSPLQHITIWYNFKLSLKSRSVGQIFPNWFGCWKPSDHWWYPIVLLTSRFGVQYIISICTRWVCVCVCQCITCVSRVFPVLVYHGLWIIMNYHCVIPMFAGDICDMFPSFSWMINCLNQCHYHYFQLFCHTRGIVWPTASQLR